jgi:hypothetical protein
MGPAIGVPVVLLIAVCGSHHVTDAELMRIAIGGHAAETVTPVSRRLAAPRRIRPAPRP